MKEIILALLIILLFIVACKKEEVQIQSWSVSKNIDSSYLDTLDEDTL